MHRTYRVQMRRKREGKTDYRFRLKMLRSGMPRAVVRKTNRNVIVQVSEFDLKGDRVIVSASGFELKKKFGFQGNTDTTPASYLAGYLAGKKALKNNVAKAVLDIGFHSPTKGARVFAVLKGLLDAGIEIPHQEEKLPDEDRLHGKHLKNFDSNQVEHIKKKIDDGGAV
ncbi:MAG: 50S ribosomal protein L18 [Thermoplasmata archaeon]|nr:50S ribosomal protein L18 [Thermoplasmata archaeon]